MSDDFDTLTPEVGFTDGCGNKQKTTIISQCNVIS